MTKFFDLELKIALLQSVALAAGYCVMHFIFHISLPSNLVWAIYGIYCVYRVSVYYLKKQEQAKDKESEA